MSQWPVQLIGDDQAPRARARAAAYYRYSAEDRQGNSVPLQQDRVRNWAQENQIKIVQEFADVSTD